MSILNRVIDAIIVNHRWDLEGYVSSLQRGGSRGPTLDEAKMDYVDFIRQGHYLG